MKPSFQFLQFSFFILMDVLLASPGDQDANVKYQTMKTCALERSSVSIACSYSYPKSYKITSTHWFKGESPDRATHDILQDHAFKDRVKYLGDRTQNCSVRINDLRLADSGTYWFVFETDHSGKQWSSSSGFKLSVTDLSVEVIPEENVTEGEVVDMFCGSCILSEAPTYVWLKDSRVVSSLERNNQLLLNPARQGDTGSYSCQVKGHEATPSRPIKLTVTCKQQVQVKLSAGQVIEGEQVELTCVISCPVIESLPTFTWYKDSSPRFGQNQSKHLVLDPVRVEDMGEYSCGLGGHKEIRSQPVQLLVQYSPKNTTAMLLREPPEGGTLTLFCSSYANPPVESYTWFKVNESTPVGSGQQYSITNSRPEDGGQYYCEAMNKIGVEKSPSILVALQDAAGFPFTMVISIVVVILVVTFIGTAVFFGIKRRHRITEGGGLEATNAKASGSDRTENAYSVGELKPSGHDYEDMTEKGLNETESPYTALNIQSQSSEYWTLKNARSTTGNSGDEPVGGIYETLDDITKNE